MRIAFLLFAFQAFALALSAHANSACKEVTIVGPAGITVPGDSMVLKVKSDIPLPHDIRFEWTVSAGTIVSGQGTGSIEVVAPPDGSAQSVSARVKITGLQAPCDEIVSAEYGIAPPIGCMLPDIYETLNRNDERARLLNAAFMLSRNPDSVLVFVLYMAPAETSAQANRRAAFIKNFFLNDKLMKKERLSVPSNRLYLAFARSDGSRTAVSVLRLQDATTIMNSFRSTTRPTHVKPAEKPQL